MRLLVALGVALALSVGGGLAMGEAQSAMTRFMTPTITSKPLDLARLYAAPAKSAARKTAQGPTASSHPRAQQKPSRLASVRHSS